MLVENNKAFTLAELLTVLTISSLLVAFAIPYYFEMLKNNKVRTDSEILMSAILLGKDKAISKGEDVAICAIDPDEDNITCLSSKSWQSWAVYYGEDYNSLDEDSLIAIYNTNGTVFESNVKIIRINDTGFAETTVTIAGQPDDCDSGNYRRELTLSLSGNVSLERVECVIAEEE